MVRMAALLTPVRRSFRMGYTGGGSEDLSERAAAMRESLRKEKEITISMMRILGSFDHRVSVLESAMRPTQMKIHSIMKANENIDKTLEVVEVIRGQFDSVRQAGTKILRGPGKDLDTYLETVEELKRVIKFLSGENALKSSMGVVNQANNILQKAIVKLEEEFEKPIIKLEEEFGQLISTYRFDAKDLLCSDWVQIHRRVVQQHANQYKRIAWAKVDTVFGSNLCLKVRESSAALTKRLAQVAQETFDDFQETVEKDVSKAAGQDGAVHPLTSYVISYVELLLDYQATILQLFKEFSDTNVEDQMTAVATRIIQALQNNLDGKSKQYRDPAFSHLFLMNNIHYIVTAVRRYDAKDLLGTDWVQMHRRVVQQHANQYKRIAWAKVLQCLTIQGIRPSSDSASTASVSKTLIKDRFKTFNNLFEEIHARQSRWVIPDSELRESLRLAIAEILLPAYRSFLKRFGSMIQSGKSPQRYIKYTVEDLDRMLGDFFEGKTLNEPRRYF